MENFLKKIIKKARNNPKIIVFPESDKRIIKACKIIKKKKIAKPIILTKQKLKGIWTINPVKSDKLEFFSTKLYKLRKNKGLSLNKAKELVEQNIYFGMMMLKLGYVDGLISGAVHPTLHTLIPAFQIIKTKKNVKKASGLFFMIKKGKIYLFADSAVNINPNAEELAEIAINSAKTAKYFEIKPKIAMLSFSTYGSASSKEIDKVRRATKIVKKKTKLIIDGEMQVDAAISREVCKIKCPKCRLKGNANILIFPNLDSGNIGYKLVERFGKFKAIGPIIQGLNKPVNDLSRGCNVKDIVNITAITVVQAQEKW